MAIDYTTDALLSDTRTKCMTPESEALFTDARLLPLLTFEQDTIIVPELISVKEEFFVHIVDVALTSALRYDLPERAVGTKLRALSLVDSGGNEVYVVRIQPENLAMLGVNADGNNWSGVFYLENDQVVFPSAPTQNFISIRYRFYRRPSNLVATSEAAQITVIDTVTNTVTCSSVPGAWVVGDTVDFIKGRPGFRSLEDDATITVLSNADVTFASLPSDLRVGDWISLSGTSPIPQIPYELHPYLAQLGAAKALESMGDAQGLQMAMAKANQIKAESFKLITPRTESPVQKLVSPNNIANRGWYGPARRFGF